MIDPDRYNLATLDVLAGYFSSAGQQLREMVLHPTGRTNKAQRSEERRVGEEG